MASAKVVPLDNAQSKTRTPKMRRSRPNSSHQSTPSRSALTRPTRKIFNCIVDDTALVAGVKRSTRNGIRQWVKHGQIRLFVPLHALEELSRQKSQTSRHGEDVRETLEWLDEATSKHPDVVTLQGADETYEKWSEVEQFVVPRTLFSEYNHDDFETSFDEPPTDTAKLRAKEDLAEKTNLSSGASDSLRSLSPTSLDSARSSTSPISPPTSPIKETRPQTKALATKSAKPQSVSSCGSVPTTLKSLFNYILWRIHQEVDPVAALESFIFLCNDAHKVSFAKGFDIKTKRLEQLREAVGREDREYKNRQSLFSRENPGLDLPTEPIEPESDEVDDFSVCASSPPRVLAAPIQFEKAAVLDPHAFSRVPQTTTATERVNQSPRSPHLSNVLPNAGSPRGKQSQPSSPRGGARSNARGSLRGAARGRGQSGLSLSALKLNQDGDSAELVHQRGRIDPDSFTRPSTRGGLNPARGGRKLWVPT